VVCDSFTTRIVWQTRKLLKRVNLFLYRGLLYSLTLPLRFHVFRDRLGGFKTRVEQYFFARYQHLYKPPCTHIYHRSSWYTSISPQLLIYAQRFCNSNPNVLFSHFISHYFLDPIHTGLCSSPSSRFFVYPPPSLPSLSRHETSLAPRRRLGQGKRIGRRSRRARL
jgi:hypothetical protein